MRKIVAILAVTTFLLSGCGKSGVDRTTSFSNPSIKDEFCGVHINYQYCKCAFHNQFCKEVGMSKKEANEYVQKEYDAWLVTQRETFQQDCIKGNAVYTDGKCEYCSDGFVAQNGECVAAAEADQPTPETKTEEESDVVADIDATLFADDCTLKTETYDADWKKYSDIDNAIPYEDRSYEAKQALVVYDNMINKMVEGFALERDMEIEDQMKQELVTYRDALVKNLKTNLLKSFWRLSWVTYTTIKSGASLGDSYSNILTTGASVETLGAGLKVMQGTVPSNSSLAIDTSSLSGQAKSVGANVALEAIDSLGDPVKIATELINSSGNAALPSADLTPEEIEILKEQHIKKGVIDSAISGITARNAERAAKIALLEAEIATMEGEIRSWESKEKERVAFGLEDSCKKLKQNAATETRE